ncbi:MAG: AAA family ATPase [Fretibacterium sp.]|nr:AAA family ATPase [Fretibacterium sp.]
MKILEIRLKNLNSLKGEWKVDLTHPAFTGDGLFAVTGPTGAGKTTLFDAVCLALYGRTPRLGKITKTTNEIMSRRTGECLAQVMFSARGKTWLCSWGQRRARGKDRGNLQMPFHELSCADTGEILASSVGETPHKVEEITGMDFERFTRAALLAQGRFDAFLKAGKDQRAKTLEMITGTELYSQISQRVFERCREERGKLEALEARRGALNPPSPEEEEAARQELERAQEKSETLSRGHERTRGTLTCLEALEDLQKELSALEADEVRLGEALEAFAPERVRLEEAQRAAALEAEYAPLVLLRQRQRRDTGELAAREKMLPQLQAALAEGTARLAAAERAVGQAKEAIDREAPLLQKVRALDLKRDASEKAAAAAEKLHGQEEKNLAGRQKERAQLEKAQIQAGKDLERARLEQGDLELQLQAAGEATRRADEELLQLLGGKLLREYRNEREALQREQVLHMKILSLEEERRQLRAGEPCPLCGAVQHPWAEGDAPELKGTEEAIQRLDTLIKQAERLETNAGKLREKEGEVRTSLARGEGEVKTAAAREEAARAALASCEKELQDRKQALDAGTEQLEKLREEAGRLNCERLELYGQRVPDEEETRLKRGLAAAEQEELRARKEAAARKQAADQAESAARALRERVEQQGEELKTRESGFLASLIQGGFEDEASFAASRLEAEALKALSGRASELEARRVELRSRRQERQEALERRRAQAKTEAAPFMTEGVPFSPGEVLKAVKACFAGEEERLREVQERVFHLKETLHRGEELREALGELVGQCEAQARETARWMNLNTLIGSADGQKYSVFAQRLTLDLVVRHANRQLRKMSSRYLLITQDEFDKAGAPSGDPLSLSVIDGEQAGEIRPTANLSGGESFIVSLALALGLSQLSGRRMRVDSLFLDEGFGALDSEALEMALEALGEVRREGRMIGIISHVQALKERIPTQIQVIPRLNGVSVLSGPGCSKEE